VVLNLHLIYVIKSGMTCPGEITIGKSEKRGSFMEHKSFYSSLTEETEELSWQQFLTFLRSRLNVISTSLYLLESSLAPNEVSPKKYIQKINQEIEAIRQILNKT